MTLDRPAYATCPLSRSARRSGWSNGHGAREYFARAHAVMPGGVPSSFQRNDPWPTYLERGVGAQVWDVDGNEYLDFHNGFGVMCVGHANPTISAAVKARMDEGTHFAAPTEGSIVVAEGSSRRWGLPTGASRTPAPSRRWTPSTSPARHRPRRDREDRGHLPRPPRRRDGLGQAARRPDGRPRPPRGDPLWPRLRPRHAEATCVIPSTTPTQPSAHSRTATSPA